LRGRANFAFEARVDEGLGGFGRERHMEDSRVERLADDEAALREDLHHARVVGRNVSLDLLDAIRPGDLGEMLKEQCTDAAPLVGGFDREPHLRPWRRCVEGSVRADALVATDAYDALVAVGGGDHGSKSDMRCKVDS